MNTCVKSPSFVGSTCTTPGVRQNHRSAHPKEDQCPSSTCPPRSIQDPARAGRTCMRTRHRVRGPRRGRAGDRDDVRRRAGAAARRRGLGGRDVHPLGTHNSTHVDAPWHYNSTIGGERAQTIDELPLDWFFGARRRARHDRQGRRRRDHRRRGRGRARADRPRARSRATSCSCGPAATSSTTQPDYMARGPGVTAEATHWLYERGVRVMGIDAWGWDAPAAPAGRGGATEPASRASSGRPTRPTSPTRRSSGSSTSARCPPTASRSPASRSSVVGGSAAPGARRRARPGLRPPTTCAACAGRCSAGCGRRCRGRRLVFTSRSRG